MLDVKSPFQADLLIVTQNSPEHWINFFAGHTLHSTNDSPDWDNKCWQQKIPSELLTKAIEIMPCASISNETNWGYQCKLEFETIDGTIGYSSLATIGHITEISCSKGGDGEVEAKIDIWRINTPLRRAIVHWEFFGVNELESATALFSLSIRKMTNIKAATAKISGVKIPVPVRSQMLLRSDIAQRVCSPTSMSMVFGYYGKSIDIYDIIDETHHQSSGLYGVWPANIYAAARRGLTGYLLHMPNWEIASKLLDQKVPLIASLRYKKNELGSNAAIEQTDGHLLVITGYSGKSVFVNDPAALNNDTVARSYDLKAFCKVWLERSAVTYVLFPTT